MNPTDRFILFLTSCCLCTVHETCFHVLLQSQYMYHEITGYVFRFTTKYRRI